MTGTLMSVQGVYKKYGYKDVKSFTKRLKAVCDFNDAKIKELESRERAVQDMLSKLGGDALQFATKMVKGIRSSAHSEETIMGGYYDNLYEAHSVEHTKQIAFKTNKPDVEFVQRMHELLSFHTARVDVISDTIAGFCDNGFVWYNVHILVKDCCTDSSEARDGLACDQSDGIHPLQFDPDDHFHNSMFYKESTSKLRCDRVRMTELREVLENHEMSKWTDMQVGTFIENICRAMFRSEVCGETWDEGTRISDEHTGLRWDWLVEADGAAQDDSDEDELFDVVPTSGNDEQDFEVVHNDLSEQPVPEIARVTTNWLPGFSVFRS